MRKLFLYSLLLLWGVLSAQAQINESTRDAMNGVGTRSFKATSSMAMIGIPTKEGEVLGNQYLDSSWSVGNIKLYKKIGPLGKQSDSIVDMPIRLDLYTNELEIRVTQNDIRGLSGDQVAHFSLQNKVIEQPPLLYTNASAFSPQDANLKGFFKVLVIGKLNLLEYTKLTISKPTYNEALGTGSKEVKITKGKTFYYALNNKAVKMTSSKKKMMELMADKSIEMEQFLKNQNLDLKNEADLSKLFSFYNSL